MTIDKPKPLPATVTMLEMTKPFTKSYSRPSNIQIMLLRSDKIPLHFYRYLQDRVGRQWTWTARLRLNDDDLSAIIHADTTDIDVLYVDGSPAGFYEIDRSDPTRTALAYFGLMDHAIGRGIGKWFLAQAISAAWENEPSSVSVNTCTLDHPSVLGLYQKLGFQVYAQTTSNFMPLSEDEKKNILK